MADDEGDVDRDGDWSGESADETWVEEADADSEWDYAVVGEGDDGPTVGVANPEGSSASVEGADGGEGVAGPFSPAHPVESGTPTLENSLFVAAGVFLMLLVIASVAVPLDAATVIGLAAAVFLVAGVLYALFRRF